MDNGAWSRVWVDDRHPIFRRGLVGCIAANGFSIAGESEGFMPAPDPTTFDLLVFEADAEQLRGAIRVVGGYEIRMVALVPTRDEGLVLELVQAGALAVLRRAQLGPKELLGALHAAAVGSTAIPGDLMPQLLERAASDGAAPVGALLTDRERAALQLLAEGYETREIAAHLCYSERTVKNIVHDLLAKTNTRNRAHVVALASRQGLI